MQHVDSNTDSKIINPTKKGIWNYSNWNFAIFRVLLPIIGGLKDFSAGFESRLASEYVKIVEENVVEPVGIRDVDCKPPISHLRTTRRPKGLALVQEMPGARVCGWQGDWEVFWWRAA